MLPFWLMFLVPAWAVLVSKRLPDRQRFAAWWAIGTLFALMIGLRHEVGGDWFNYLDHFKTVARMEFATAMKKGDPGHYALNWLVARLGGEEFGVLIAEATPGEAMAVAEAIRQALAQAPWRAVDAQLQGATVSIGLCCGVGPLDGDALYARADAALYAAKRNGRDRIETAHLSTATGLRAG